jgi:hypothetical protein
LRPRSTYIYFILFEINEIAATSYDYSEETITKNVGSKLILDTLP